MVLRAPLRAPCCLSIVPPLPSKVCCGGRVRIRQMFGEALISGSQMRGVRSRGVKWRNPRTEDWEQLMKVGRQMGPKRSSAPARENLSGGLLSCVKTILWGSAVPQLLYLWNGCEKTTLWRQFWAVTAPGGSYQFGNHCLQLEWRPARHW